MEDRGHVPTDGPPMVGWQAIAQPHLAMSSTPPVWPIGIEERESIDTERAFVREAGVPVSLVLSELGKRLSLDAVLRGFSKPKWGGRSLSRDDLLACAESALGLVRRGDQLLPSVVAALTEKWAQQHVVSLVGEERSLDPSLASALEREWSLRLRGSIEEVRAAADELLAGIVSGSAVLGQTGMSQNLESQALRFASALVREGRLPASPQPDVGRFIREMVADPTRRIVDEHALYLSELLDQRITPEILFRRWDRRVARIEAGCDDFWELQESLRRRDMLEEALLLLPPAALEQVRAMVAPLDAQYEHATEPVDAPIYGRRAPWRREYWWWYRVPLLRGAELESELMRNELLGP